MSKKKFNKNEQVSEKNLTRNLNEKKISAENISTEKKINEKSFPKNFEQKKIIAGIILLAIIVAGATTGAIILSKNNNAETMNEILNLANGENLISSGGTYRISGEADGFVHVNAGESEIKLQLENVSLSNADGPAIYVESNGDVTIELIGENKIESTPTEELDAAIYSKADLTFMAEENAALEINSTLDGIGGKDSVEIENGKYEIKSTGKSLKAKDALKILDGEFVLSSEDDAIHSNGDLEILDGEFSIAGSDDGAHADGTLTISGGKIDITEAYEGLEANILNLLGGEISIVASDDGINATNSGSNETFQAGDAELNIGGGKISVDADGDGLDSNGSIKISGGEILVNGPTTSADAAVDCDGEITIEGGTLVAVGASGMAQNATSATQPSILMNLEKNYSAALEFGGIKFTPSKSYNSVLISSPTFKTGETYELKIGGETVESVKVEEMITGTGNMMGGGRPGFGGEMNQEFGNGEQPRDFDGERPDFKNGEKPENGNPPAMPNQEK